MAYYNSSQYNAAFGDFKKAIRNGLEEQLADDVYYRRGLYYFGGTNSPTETGTPRKLRCAIAELRKSKKDDSLENCDEAYKRALALHVFDVPMCREISYSVVTPSWIDNWSTAQKCDELDTR